MTTRIVFLDRAIFAPSVDLRAPAFDHIWIDHVVTPRDAVIARLANAEIAVTSKIPIGRAEFEALPSLRMIAIAGAGVDHIDLAEAKARGVTVANLKGYAWRAVAEHAIAMTFALARNLQSYGDAVAAGRWTEAEAFCWHGGGAILDLLDATFVVVGKGAIGGEAGRLAAALGMRVLYAERPGATDVRPGYVSFEAALAAADVLSLHCPLTEQTRHMIDAAACAKMRRQPILINCGRGGLVDETALEAALDAGQIRAAGFDVLSKEPPQTEDANPLLKLAGRPNVLLTPHVGWASRTAMQAAADMLIGNIEAFVAGAPTNTVDG